MSYYQNIGNDRKRGGYHGKEGRNNKRANWDSRNSGGYGDLAYSSGRNQGRHHGPYRPKAEQSFDRDSSTQFNAGQLQALKDSVKSGRNKKVAQP